METQPNTGNLSSTDKRVLFDYKLLQIKNFIKENLQVYIQNFILPENKINLYITESWVNFTKRGQFHHQHYHHNSLVSGVFYINADAESDKINFVNDRKELYSIVSKEFNIWNSTKWWIPIETGDLILFPSYLPHEVAPVTSKETRISLSFNTFVEGELGTPSQTTELILRRSSAYSGG